MPEQMPALRSRLLYEATEALARDGVAALTVRRVAEAAGCSTIGIYTHFGSKQGLIEALLLDAYDDFAATLATIDSQPPGRAQLVAGAHVYREWALANRSRYLAMFASYLPDFTPSVDALQRMGQSLQGHTRRVAAAIAARELAGEAEEVAYHIWACIHGHVMLELFYLRGGESAAHARAAFGKHVDDLFDGIAERRPRRQR